MEVQQEQQEEIVSKRHLRFAMVCAANNNRSMEAHNVLKRHNFNVSSYGVGAHVKLPGPSRTQPNVYKFGTPYQVILDDLLAKDSELYHRNGLVKMLQRNVSVKQAPERFQENRDFFDVIVTFEERVMEQVLEDLQHRPRESMKPVLVINMDTKDNHEEAANAAPLAMRLCYMIEEAGGCWEEHADALIDAFTADTGRRATYSVCCY